jgi:hypothetical protein
MSLYKLIVAVRQRSATPNHVGSYPQAFGEFAFDAVPSQIPSLTGNTKAALGTGCVDFVLFRVAASQVAKTPLKTPFVPADYGNDLKVLYSAYDGNCP